MLYKEQTQRCEAAHLKPSTYHVIDEAGPCRGRLQPQQGGQAPLLLHDDPIHIQETSNVSSLWRYWNGQRGQKDSSGHPGDKAHVQEMNC